MAVSVIISNFNGDKYLTRLLDSLGSQKGVELQIIVVDRNSSDSSEKILAQYPNICVLNEPPESGLVSGYHAGVNSAIHPNVFFCNEDMWFEDDCLALLEKHLNLSGNVWAADPAQWTYDGKTQIHGLTRFVNVWKPIPNSPHPFRKLEFCDLGHDGDKVPFGCAGAIMVVKDIYLQLGGWDRSFFLESEDTDLFLRAWRRGYSCSYVPSAKVYHAVSVASAKVINGGKTLVGKRRYISAFASQLIISIKYFPLHWVAFHFIRIPIFTAYHLVSGQPKYALWDLLAIKEVWTRVGAAVRFRRSTAQERFKAPGNLFYSENLGLPGSGSE
jgi:GT2 family glycosyltransferase